jgi:hypothetical protein
VWRCQKGGREISESANSEKTALTRNRVHLRQGQSRAKCPVPCPVPPMKCSGPNLRTLPDSGIDLTSFFLLMLTFGPPPTPEERSRVPSDQQAPAHFRRAKLPRSFFCVRGTSPRSPNSPVPLESRANPRIQFPPPPAPERERRPGVKGFHRTSGSAVCRRLKAKYQEWGTGEKLSRFKDLCRRLEGDRSPTRHPAPRTQTIHRGVPEPLPTPGIEHEIALFVTAICDSTRR